MQPLFEHTMKVAGVHTRALELEGDGPPLLLLHGYADSADTWRHVLGGLGRNDRRAIAVDMPGFGHAGAGLKAGPIVPQLERFAAALVERLGADGDVIVAGNSLGGCMSLRLAGRGDLPLAGVMPIAPAGLDMARWFTVIEGAPLLRRLLTAPVPMPEQAVRMVVAQVYRALAFHRPGAVDGRVVSTFTSHHRDRTSINRQLDIGRRLLPEIRAPELFALDGIDVPVLVVWGDRDRMVFHSGAERVLEAVPGAELDLIPDCGHCPQVEAPRRLVDLLLDFPAPLRKAA